jgi:hypothetical protein
MRYISAPHRSHSVSGSAAGATRIGDTRRAGGRGGVGSDMEADYFTDATTAANQRGGQRDRRRAMRKLAPM